MNHHRRLRGAEKKASGSGNYRFLSDFHPSENSACREIGGNLPRYRRTLRRLPSGGLRHRNPAFHDQCQNRHRRSAGAVSDHYRNRETGNPLGGVLTASSKKEHLLKRSSTENPGTERVENGFQARRNPKAGRCGGRHSHRLCGISLEGRQIIRNQLVKPARTSRFPKRKPTTACPPSPSTRSETNISKPSTDRIRLPPDDSGALEPSSA